MTTPAWTHDLQHVIACSTSMKMATPPMIWLDVPSPTMSCYCLQYLHEDGYTTYGMVGCTQPHHVMLLLAVPPRRWLHYLWYGWMYPASSCRCHVRGQACLRGDGCDAGGRCWIRDTIRGLHLPGKPPPFCC